MRTRIRSRGTRIRVRKAGIRAEMRITAEKHAPLSGIACYVRIEVIGEVSSRMENPV